MAREDLIENLNNALSLELAGVIQYSQHSYLVTGFEREVYKEFLATFFGQAIFQLRLDNTREPEHPCLVLIDEAKPFPAANLPPLAVPDVGKHHCCQ